jgi:hypothetical protein
MKPPLMTVTTDFTKDFNDLIKRFRNEKVLVGIPEDKSSRRDDSGITNAALLAINNFGSPANGIPPRPVMQIGIKNAQPEIAEQFKLAAQTVLSKGQGALDTYYERAGIIAANSIKKAINDQEGIAPLSPKTIAARKREGFQGEKALLRSAQLRNSITFVIVGKS